jgi:hypothetical protein
MNLAEENNEHFIYNNIYQEEGPQRNIIHYMYNDSDYDSDDDEDDEYLEAQG